MLQHLKQNNIPIALATSSNKENFELKTQRWKNIFDLFNHKVLGGSDPDVINGKPAPDIFLIAAKRFIDNPDPSKVCYNLYIFFPIIIYKFNIIFLVSCIWGCSEWCKSCI